MVEQFYTITTQVGKAKIANASALGNKVSFTHFALGDGNGGYYNPTENQTALKKEVWRGNIGQIVVDENNPSWIILETIIPANVGGFTIREAGVLDDEGNLLAIGKYPETYKPLLENGSAKDLYIRMILEVANTSVVNLKVDPSIILATKKDIDILSNGIAKVEEDIKNTNYTTIESTSRFIYVPNNIEEGIVKLNIEGNTVSNKIQNGDFSNDTTNWVSYHSISSVVDGNVVSTGNGTAISPYIHQATKINPNTSYYVRCTMRVTRENCIRIGVRFATELVGVENPTRDKWYVVQGIVNTLVDGNGVEIRQFYDDTNSANGATLEIDNIVLLDLSQHPQYADLTAEEINERIPNYVEGTQSIEGLKIKSTGENLFVSELELGMLDIDTGLPIDGTTRLRTKDFIKVSPDIVYSVSNDKDYTNVYYFYDANKQLISWGYDLYNPSFTTPNDCYYIKFRTGANQTDLNVKFQLEKGEVITKETYTFISEGLYSLPDGTKDTLEGNKLTRRINKSVIDGRFNFDNFRISATVIYARIPDFISSHNATYTINYLGYSDDSGLFKTYLASHSEDGTPQIVPNNVSIYIVIPKQKVTDQTLDGFKNYLNENPIDLYYELETPEVRELDLSNLVARKNGRIILENWDKYTLKINDITGYSNTTYQNIDWGNMPLFKRYGRGSYDVENKIYIPSLNKEIGGNAEAYKKSKGYDFSPSQGHITYLLPKGLANSINEFNLFMVGTIVYYKVASKYEVTPKWSVDVPITLKSQIVENTKAISEVSTRVNKNADLTETIRAFTEGIRTEGLSSPVLQVSGRKWELGFLTAFQAGVDDQKVDIVLGKLSFLGTLIITISSGWGTGNAIGSFTKVCHIGYGGTDGTTAYSGNQYSYERVCDRTASYLGISDMVYDNELGRFKFTVGKRANMGGNLTINITIIPNSPTGGQNLVRDMYLSDVYTSPEPLERARETLQTDPWINATLENGWTGIFQYRKNAIGQLEINFSLDSGAISTLTNITTLPVGYRPRRTTPVNIVKNATGNVINGAISVVTTGHFRLTTGAVLEQSTRYEGSIIIPI